jgi:hypothetical protein
MSVNYASWPATRQVIDTGGSAFDMTLRDYFAGQALPGVLQARAALAAQSLARSEVRHESIAAECYELADALLAARTR